MLLPDLQRPRAAPATLRTRSYCCPLHRLHWRSACPPAPSEVQATLTVQLQLPRAVVVDHGQSAARPPLTLAIQTSSGPRSPPEAQATLTVQLQLPGAIVGTTAGSAAPWLPSRIGPPAAGSGVAAARTAAPGGTAPPEVRGPSHCTRGRRSASVRRWPDHGQNNGSHARKPRGRVASPGTTHPDPGTGFLATVGNHGNAQDARGHLPRGPDTPGKEAGPCTLVARGCTVTGEKQVTW